MIEIFAWEDCVGRRSGVSLSVEIAKRSDAASGFGGIMRVEVFDFVVAALFDGYLRHANGCIGCATLWY